VEVTLHMAKVLGDDDPQHPRDFYQNGATVLDRLPAGEKFAEIFANTKWDPESEGPFSSSVVDGSMPFDNSSDSLARPKSGDKRRRVTMSMTITETPQDVLKRKMSKEPHYLPSYQSESISDIQPTYPPLPKSPYTWGAK
jgi:hypothetical protein